MEENVQAQLSPPWITYFNELKNSTFDLIIYRK
ncbi:hypothetical protein FORC085_2243 [Bacillus cereus]|nr:hypothetical protein FORC085_2243 [Bacillus cereus]